MIAMLSMNNDLSVPSSASLYILLQRTAYQSTFLARLLRHLPGPISLAYASVEARVRRNVIVSRFQRGIHRDFRSIESALPPVTANILDIGCGLAALDVLLYHYFSNPSPPDLYLAGFEETSYRLDYRFGQSPSRYNSFNVARELLINNGIPPQACHFINPDEIIQAHDLPRFNLVISTLAWGFHFPVDTYAEAVSKVVAEEGRIILDLRRDTDGIEQLEKVFRVAKIIEENETRQRVLAISPKVS
jgi:SAM-dependent methyltransferase